MTDDSGNCDGGAGESFVRTEALTKCFGDFTALDDVSVSIRRGKIIGLLGPNGAGKSTLLRLLLGFMRPTSGTATIGGLDCWNEKTRAHQLLTYLPGDARLDRGAKGKTLLKFFSSLRSDGNYDKAVSLADELELDLKRRVAFMSTGMRQKLALSICLSVDAPLIILDEPTANLDPTVRQQVLQLVLKAKSENSAVIFSSHVLSEIEQTCDEVIFLRKGRKMLQDSVATLKGGHRLIAQLDGELSIPDSFNNDISIVSHKGSRIELEIAKLDSQTLSWIAEQPFSETRLEAAGLQATYDQLHR